MSAIARSMLVWSVGSKLSVAMSPWSAYATLASNDISR
jgi:hypothetical protein